MATSKLTKTATQITKAETDKLVEKAASTSLTIKPAKAAAKKAVNPNVRYVTSFNLKRTHVPNAVQAKLFFNDEDYRTLGTLGFNLGVTWDEVVRGCINSIFASNDPLGTLRHFVPALQ